MESFLPSEIGRLIYGYLSECDQHLADMFLNSSSVMEECRMSKNKSRKFSAKVQGLSLVDILDQYSILCSLIFKNIGSTDCVHRNIVNLLKNVLYSKLGEHNRSLADKFLTQENDNVSRMEHTFNNSINGSNPHNVPNDEHTTVDSCTEAAIPSSQSELEKMNISNNSVITEYQKPKQMVTKIVQTELPLDTINLLESDTEPVTNTGNVGCAQIPTPRSPIDLTSPLPCNATNSPKVANNINEVNQSKKSVVSPLRSKIKSISPKSKFKSNILKPASLPTPKSFEPKKSNDSRTPPENVKNSRLLDTNVFNNLSFNSEGRRESYQTPLKLNHRNYVFGENLLYIDNSRCNPHDTQTISDKPVPVISDAKNNAKITSLLNGQNKDIVQSKTTVKPPTTPTNETTSNLSQKERPPLKVVLQKKTQEKRESPRRKTPKAAPRVDKISSTKAKSTPVARQLSMKHTPRTPKETPSIPCNPSEAPLPLTSLPVGASSVSEASGVLPSPPAQPTVAPTTAPVQLSNSSVAPITEVAERDVQPLETPTMGKEIHPKSNDGPEPWDSKLRRLIGPHEEERLAAEASKTPKRCKRNKATEQSSKKRKLEESQNVDKAKKVCKNRIRKEAKEACKTTDTEMVNNTQPVPAENKTPEAQPTSKSNLSQWLKLGEPMEPKSRSSHKQTPQTNHQASPRLPNLHAIQQTPETNRVKSLTSRTPESRLKDSPKMYPSGKNSPLVSSQRLVNETVGQTVQEKVSPNDSNIIASILRQAAENASCKMELESVISVAESNPESPDRATELTLSEEFVLFSNTHVDL